MQAAKFDERVVAGGNRFDEPNPPESATRQMVDPQAASAPADEILTLRTLGGFGLFDARERLVLGPGKPLALLAYLHSLPAQSASRDHLLHTLWADLNETDAAHALRQTVYFLRGKLGSNCLAVASGTVGLIRTIGSDRTRFLAAIAENRLADAVAAYGGEFLPGFALPGGLGFEQWADAERRRLSLLFARAAEAIAHEALGAGHIRGAREIAERVRDADPLEESGWRLLLEAIIAGGDRVTALTEARRLEDMLSVEGRVAQPATNEMLRRARAEPGESAPATEPSLAAELVGREREFAQLLAGFSHVKRERASTIQLVAPAGLGKTRLLRDFERRLTASGELALYARAQPADRDVTWSSLSTLVQLLAPLPGALGVSSSAASTLVALNPASAALLKAQPRASNPSDTLRERIEAVTELVEAISEERPLALLIDDLHWADPTSRDVVQRVAAKSEAAHVLFVLSHRPGIELPVVGHHDVINLEALTEEQAHEFLSSLGAVPDESWASEFPARLRRATDGSPLLLLETIQHAMETGGLALTDGRWCCPDVVRLNELLQSGGALRRRISQLDRSQGWLLLLLSLAGRAMPRAMLGAPSNHSEARVSPALSDLERAGLVTRSADEWSVAHDEIAEQVVQMASAEQRTAAHGALGREALRLGSRDGGTLRLAASHLVAASLDQDLSVAARNWVRQLRASGDRRHTRALVGELIGAPSDDTRTRAIVKSLPWRFRVRRTHAVAGMAATVALLATAALVAAPRLAPDESGVVLASWKKEPNGHWRMASRAISQRDAMTRSLAMGSLLRTGVVASDRPGALPRPGGKDVFAETQVFRDSGGEEVVVRSARDGWTRRLTHSRGDDEIGDWSPDGRFLVIQTDRWSTKSLSDIAIIDPDRPDSIVRRLTFSRGSRNTEPLWSPDGAHIAFWRTMYGEGKGGSAPHAICVVDVDGADERCFATPGYSPVTFIGWANPLQVTGVSTDSLGVNRIHTVTLSSAEVREIAEGESITQSHAAGWFACFCRLQAPELHQALLFDLSRADRPVRLEPGDPPPELSVLPAPGHESYLDRVSIAGADQLIPVDGTYRVRLLGRDLHGRRVEPQAVRWSSRDTSVAAVSADGLVHPKRPGSVTLTATAGGWRSDSAVITIGAATSVEVLSEIWTADFNSRWAPFGEPRPFVTRTPRGPALAPNGDSTFTSGVYLRQHLPTSGGLGVEFELSAPISMPFWQTLWVRLAPADSVDFSGWDHRTGFLPLPDQHWRTCGIDYPYGANHDQIRLGAGVIGMAQLPRGAPAGEWVRVRLQLLADGRCGVAVNGTATTIVDRRVPLGDSALLVIDGYSYHTRILIGPLTIWRGVRRDVDWSVAEAGRREGLARR